MTIKLYNTLTRKKEVFTPLTPNKVGMYVCGVTVYDSCHLGHARAALTFDMISRYLRFAGFDVKYVTNFTDVDDKIIKRANTEHVSSEEISKRYISEYKQDMASLGIEAPSELPKATEHIAEMIAMIQKLIERKVAYAVDGSVFFSVRAFPEYGKLSGKKIEDLEVGARIDIDEAKKDPLDFVLWKPAKTGEPSWPSPWGDGRPGWHIECSAMSCKYLGETFDIHGGGRDISFPHHENEIAQSEGASGKPFANYWLHNGMITMNGEKMSKSLGNVENISQLVKKYNPEVIRLFVFSNHYRSPLDYTEQNMNDSKSALDRYYETLARVHLASKASGAASVEAELKIRLADFRKDFSEAMDDDFNTAVVIGKVFELVRMINRFLDEAQGGSAWLKSGVDEMQNILGKVLGVFGSNPKDYFEEASRRVHESVDVKKIEELLSQRQEARSNKNFAESDAIRDQLLAMGVELKDLPGGKVEWKLK